MRVLAEHELPALPSEVRGLVAQGIYSLYELRGDLAEQAPYLLMTGDEFYFLAKDGTVIGKPEGVSSPAELPEMVPVSIPLTGPVARINLG